MKKVLIALLVIICGCVSSDDQLQLSNRITALENQGLNYQTTYMQNNTKLENLESKINEIAESRRLLESQLREQYATLKASSNNGRHSIRQISGRLEEIEYHLKQKYNLKKSGSGSVRIKAENLSSVKRRLDRIEQYLGLEPYDESKVSVVGDSKASSEDQLYLSAKKLFDSGDTETARIQFNNFLKQFPKSKNADNAQFWIAEIYFKDKWYEKAILEYQKVIEGYTDGNKVPAALLKQGMSFLLLNDKPNASLILRELINKYPKSKEANIARKKLTSIN